MEDIARLALVEQSLRDVDNFSKVLHELLQEINQVLENPYEHERRTLKSGVLKKVLHSEAFTDYLKYIGFRLDGSDYVYPKEQTLDRLRIARAAIERKIYFCCGSLHRVQRRPRSSHSLHTKKVKFSPSNVLKTKNPLLLKLESLFNNVIRYESLELQDAARTVVPLVTLQLMALDRVRDQQRKIKTGEITARDLSFDIALLLELLGWFKHKFFTWVDKPACHKCSTQTVFAGTKEMTTETETCTVEVYKCLTCQAETKFPRYNDPRTLLTTRRGRCGEWANCFTLLCRALGYDTRYVYDTTDHVWCEIFDTESNQWLHVDPCEGQMNTPLMYAHGWGKEISYVFAVSRDDLQDVTWRYTVDHKEVLRRRNLCGEGELIAGILALREHRQRQVSEARRWYLARRALQELVQLMKERKPSEYESHGRISGGKEWRAKRGEAGKHTFNFTEPGTYDILYYTASDKYEVLHDGKLIEEIESWEAGVYESQDIFRKHEKDWQMVYLAREEGSAAGAASWRLRARGGGELRVSLGGAEFGAGRVALDVAFDRAAPEPAAPAPPAEGSAAGAASWRLRARGGGELRVSLGGAEFGAGRVALDVAFDRAAPEPAAPAPPAEAVTFVRAWSECEVRARLRGGGGAGWQSAQLARQRAADTRPALAIRAVLKPQDPNQKQNRPAS